MSPDGSERGWLGLGVALRLAHLRELDERRARGAPSPAVLELTPSHFFGRPELLDALADTDEAPAIVLHDVLASLATAGALDRPHLARVAALARRCGAVAYSDHLAMTRAPNGLELGHLVPVPRTRAQLDALVEHISAARDILALPIAVELPTTTLELPGAELDEGEFVHALVERSGCGLHLDLDNLRVDAHNEVALATASSDSALAGRLLDALVSAGLAPALAERVAPRLAALPLDAVTRVHLAGGHVDGEGWAVDSHRAPVPEPTLAMLAGLRGFVRPRAIIIERDDQLPPLAALIDELERVRERWQA